MNEVTKGYVRLMDSGHALRHADPATSQGGDSNSQQESALVSRVLAGDQAAFNEFYQHYVPRLFQFIYYTLNGNREDAEDVLQETMLAAVRSLHRYRGDSSLYTWLYAIARNKIGDHIRHNRRRDRQTVATNEALREPAGAIDKTVIDRSSIEEAFSTLSEDYRMVLLGKYYEGLSVSELAHILGRSEKAVESLLTRARHAFEARFQDAQPDQR